MSLKETDFQGWVATEQYPRVHRFIMERQMAERQVEDEAVNEIYLAFARNGYAPIMFHRHPKQAPCENHDEKTHRYFIDVQDDDVFEKVTVIP